jgi:hypothetical protein
MFFPHLIINITCSHLRDNFLAFVLGLSSLGVRRNLLEGLFFGKVVLYTIGRFTTREWLMLLHEIVSVFSSKLLE